MVPHEIGHHVDLFDVESKGVLPYTLTNNDTRSYKYF